MVNHWGILDWVYLRGRYDYIYMSTFSFDILSSHSCEASVFVDNDDKTKYARECLKGMDFMEDDGNLH